MTVVQQHHTLNTAIDGLVLSSCLKMSWGVQKEDFTTIASQDMYLAMEGCLQLSNQRP